MAWQRDWMVATEAGSTVTIARSEARAMPNVAGFLATACIVCLYVLFTLTWPVGAVGDLLLGGALIGLLFRTPHTVAIWAALTLLVLTAIVLSIHSDALAESFANLVYYGLVVGCLWAIWNIVAERFRWNMPATVLFERVERRMRYHTTLLFQVTILFILIIVGAGVTGAGMPAAGLLTLIAVAGLFRQPRFTFILTCGATLTVLTIFQAIVGHLSLAILSGLLACGSFVTALFWFVCRAQLARCILHDSARLPVASTAVNRCEGAPRREQESEHIVADV
jgi:hypothetical protein